MFIKRTLLTLMTLFMAVSGMPVYAEKAPAPEVTEQKDDAQASAEGENVLGIKKLYAEEPSMLTTGVKFNAAIKTLAAGKSKSFNSTDSLIQSVQVVDAPPSGSIATKDVSANNDGSYLAWWDADTKTIYLYSKSGAIVLNPDSSSMFSWCSSLTTLDVSKWDTSQVTDMNSMLRGCSNLTALDASNWDTSKVTDMSSMFQNCSSLTTLDVSKWNTIQVTNMGSMFSNCRGLTTSYIGPNWNTDKVTDSGNMFRSCTKLPNFNSSVVDKTNAHAGADGYMKLKS